MEPAEGLRELVQSLAKLPSLFSLGFDAIALYGPDGGIVAGNQAARALIGGELLGAHYARYVAPRELEKVASRFARALGGEQVEFESVFIDDSGKERPVLVRLVPALVESAIVGAFGFARDVIERRRAEAACETGHAELESLFAENSDAIAIVDTNGVCVRINPAAELLLGYRSEELGGKLFGRIGMNLSAQQQVDFDGFVASAIGTGKPRDFEFDTVARAGSRLVLGGLAVPIVVEATVTGLFIIARDITKGKVAAEQSALINRRGREIHLLGSDVTDPDLQVRKGLEFGLIEFGFDSAFEIAATDDAGVVSVRRQVGQPLSVGVDDPLLNALFQQTLAAKAPLAIDEAELLRRSADLESSPPFCHAFLGVALGRTGQHRAAIVFLAHSAKPPFTPGDLEISDGIGRLVGAGIERLAEERRLESLAALDPLTRLANRLALSDHFERAIAAALRTGDEIAVYYIDIDKFKTINDTYGHGIGDEVLRTAASRMVDSCRRSDTVARIGGDEFVVLRPGPSVGRHAEALADRMRAKLEAPCTFETLTLSFTVAIGISVFPGDGGDERTLLERADAALYAAKARGIGAAGR